MNFSLNDKISIIIYKPVVGFELKMVVTVIINFVFIMMYISIFTEFPIFYMGKFSELMKA